MFKQSALRSIVALPLLASSVAFAAVPAGVTSAIETGQADMTTVAGLMLAVVVALIAFKLIRRALS